MTACDRDMITLPAVHSFARLDHSKFRTAQAADQIMTDLELLPYFLQSKPELRPTIRSVVRQIAELAPDLLEFAQSIFSARVLHLSLGGSAVFKSHPADLDFNLILEGSHFSYRDFKFSDLPQFSQVKDVLDLFSFITFGSDDLVGKTLCDDSISNQGYVHQDVMSREMLVYDMRNLLLYGHPVKVTPKPEHVLMRVMTGIGFARRGLTGEVVRYTTPERKMRKAVSRIEEAEAILAILVQRGLSG